MDREPVPRRGAGLSPRRGAPAPHGAPMRAGQGRPAGQTPPQRRVTAAEQTRRRRRRAVLGALLVVAVLALGIVISARLLFKVGEIRLENLDGTTPAATGVYTEQQILDVLGVQMGDNLLGFSARAKSEQLAAQLPYLEEVTVHITLPGTVVVKLQPVVERFALQQADGWLILSERLKVVRSSETVPENGIVLQATLPPGPLPVPGQYLKLQSYNSLFDVADPAATPAPDSTEVDAAMAQLLDGLAEQGLMDGLTALSVADLSELSFTYQGRVLVRLGTDNRLADKLLMAANALLPGYEQSLGATDRGILEFYQYSGSELRAFFSPGDPNAGTAPPADPLPDDPVTDPVIDADDAADPGPAVG